jgi:glycosyltransferase involved in cell wall biosynthesis
MKIIKKGFNKQPTIAFVANTAWFIFNFRIGIIRKLQVLGYHIIVITPDDNKYSIKLQQEGCQHVPIILDATGISIINEIKSIYNLYAVYAQIKPHFIFHYTIKLNIYGTIVAFLNQIPRIAVVCGTGYVFLKKNLLYYWVIGLYRLSFALANEVWFPNNDEKKFFETKKIATPSKTRLLPGEGINTTFFKPTLTSKPQDKYIFLLTARLIWDKGIKEYAEAARILKEKYGAKIECQLLGFLNANNPHAISQNVVNQWHTEKIINYMGATEDVRPYLEKVHCFVLPSFYCEGTPRSLLEAASMELPIITTDNQGCRDVVEHGFNGFLTQPKNVSDLVAKMEQMFLSSKEMQTQMGKKGRLKVIQNFEETLVLPYYLNSLKKFGLCPSYF